MSQTAAEVLPDAVKTRQVGRNVTGIGFRPRIRQFSLPARGKWVWRSLPHGRTGTSQGMSNWNTLYSARIVCSTRSCWGTSFQIFSATNTEEVRVTPVRGFQDSGTIDEFEERDSSNWATNFRDGFLKTCRGHSEETLGIYTPDIDAAIDRL